MVREPISRRIDGPCQRGSIRARYSLAPKRGRQRPKMTWMWREFDCEGCRRRLPVDAVSRAEHGLSGNRGAIPGGGLLRDSNVLPTRTAAGMEASRANSLKSATPRRKNRPNSGD